MQLNPDPAAPRVVTAVLFINWADSPQGEAPLGTPNALLPLIDRPMLQQVIERLAGAGSKHIHVVLGEYPLPVKALLADGARWGCELIYHHLHPNERLDQLFNRMGLKPNQHYWLADATTLPIESDFLSGLHTLHASLASPPAAGCASFWQDEQGKHWSGWGLFSGAWLLTHPIKAEQIALANELQHSPLIEEHAISPPHSVRSPAALLASSQQRLQAAGEDSIVIGRDCQIHASVQFVGPVHLGRQVKIAANALIGPHVVIGDGAFIDREARLQHCVVLPDTYVGEALDLETVVARGPRLANITLDTLVEVPDPHLLAALPQQEEGGAGTRWADKWFAWRLRIGLAPLQWLCALLTPKQDGESATEKTRATLPRPGQVEPTEIRLELADPRHAFRSDQTLDWIKHFRHTFYPGLREVTQGRLALVGPTLRPLAKVRQLHAEWRALYAENRSGLINEGLLQYAEFSLEEMQFASDAMACASQTQPRQTRQLVRQYLARVLRELFSLPLSPMKKSPDRSAVNKTRQQDIT